MRERGERRPGRTKALKPLGLALAVALTGFAVSACGALPRAASGVNVVAAENFWGSIASQLAGTRATVQSIIVNPATDPHSYEPTAADARAIATSGLVIVNGVGYDPWAPRLLAANPVAGRRTLTVGALFGLHDGENPHRWYSPADVDAVARAIAGALMTLDPRDSGYFAARLSALQARGLAQYRALIAAIRARYAGMPVGASESIFALLAPALGLKLITPYSFMKAISEGTELSARDISTAEAQITEHRLKVWVYNSQNATPEIVHLNALARRAGIPIATITETLSPATASFQGWQAAQLRQLARALRTATGR
jgi:zinc/manganese transport system substrate-binding protein